MSSDYGGVATVSTNLNNNIPPQVLTLDKLITSSKQNSVANIVNNSQINYTLIGIVSKENKSYKSGYEVSEHVNGNITLVLVDTGDGSRRDIPINLGPKNEEGGQPGVNLIEYIKNNYPHLEILITGRRLEYKDENIKNEISTPGIDIEKVIEKYTGGSDEKETTDNNKAMESDVGLDVDYVNDEQNPDSGSNQEVELVAMECEPGESSESEG
jgi:hypothetical protein